MTDHDVAARPSAGPPEPPDIIRYELDSYGWAIQQIEHLRAGHREALDLPHLAQTLAGLALQERTKLKAALEDILLALTKWDHAPDARQRAWSLTIHQQRRRLLKQIRRQPGLLAAAPSLTRDAFALARDAAAKELKLDRADLPEVCPYGWADITEREIAWLDV